MCVIIYWINFISLRDAKVFQELIRQETETKKSHTSTPVVVIYSGVLSRSAMVLSDTTVKNFFNIDFDTVAPQPKSDRILDTLEPPKPFSSALGIAVPVGTAERGSVEGLRTVPLKERIMRDQQQHVTDHFGKENATEAAVLQRQDDPAQSDAKLYVVCALAVALVIGAGLYIYTANQVSPLESPLGWRVFHPL
jgi:hypothetical protein